MSDILITGFEPFDGSKENPSQQVVGELDGAIVGGSRAVSAVLPVAARRAPDTLRRLLEKHRPRIVLMMGEFRGSPCLRIERIAVNLLHAPILDNDGVKLDDEPIDPQGPAAYWMTLPHQTVLNAIRKIKVPCVYSFSAGTFLCNQVSYLARAWCETHSPSTQVGFIHLPSLPSQMHDSEAPKPVMALPTMVAAIRAALEAAASKLGKMKRK